MIVVKRVIASLIMVTIVFALVGCNKTSYEGSSNITEASELEALSKDSQTVVIDARSKEDYDKGHLEGAINLPPSELTISDPVSGMIAPLETVEEVLGAHGISASSKVYVYDNAGGVYASRVWWVLKVYGHENVEVINNGETAVVNSGLTLTLDVPTMVATDYKGKALNTSMLATLDDVMAVADGSAAGRIIDVRSTAEYDEGAIPTAILYPHTKNLYNDGTFRSDRDTYLNYSDLGLKKDEAVILYCKTSFRATQTALLLEEAGYTNVKVYDGAWLEWSTKDMPKQEQIETTTPSTQDAS